MLIIGDKNKLPNYTGERLEKHFFNRTTIEHLHRYAIATKYVKDKIVLDIASGEGYGTNLISKHAEFVYGVDIDLTTIESAKQKYQAANISFLQGSTSKIPLGDNSVDIVISFETLEHHDEHEKMISEIKRVLKKGGLLIISTPDKKVYSDERNYSNPYHVKELYKEEFEKLLEPLFSNVVLFNQAYSYGNSFIYDFKKNQVITYSGGFDNLYEIQNKAKFLLAIASDDSFEVDTFSVFDASSKIKEFEDLNLIERYKKSYSYRIGQFVLLPLNFLKKLLK